MAENLRNTGDASGHGMQLPEEGSFVRYQPVDGSTPNVAIVKAVSGKSDLLVQLEILWRDGQDHDPTPAGGWYGYRAPSDTVYEGQGTWHWPPRVQKVPDVFEEMPDVSDDPVARQRRIEELGG